MTILFEPTKEQQEGFSEWYESRPKVIQDLVNKFPFNKLYLLKTSNHRVTIYSYAENGTMIVSVTGKYNLVAFNRNVFGIRPEDLEECDLPSPEEKLGAVANTEEEITEIIDWQRKTLYGIGN